MTSEASANHGYDFENLERIYSKGTETWKHYNQFLYAYQFSQIKNYLWLNITVITFLGIIFHQFIDPIAQTANQCEIYALMLWSASALFTIISTIIETAMLSTFWFKLKFLAPFTEGGAYVKRFEYFGSNSAEYYSDLKDLIDYLDEETRKGMKLVSIRGNILRAVNIITILSMLLLAVSFALFFYNQIGELF